MLDELSKYGMNVKLTRYKIYLNILIVINSINIILQANVWHLCPVLISSTEKKVLHFANGIGYLPMSISLSDWFNKHYAALPTLDYIEIQ